MVVMSSCINLPVPCVSVSTVVFGLVDHGVLGLTLEYNLSDCDDYKLTLISGAEIVVRVRVLVVE